MTEGASRDATDRKIFDALLRELRINSGLRQIDIAERLGISQSMVSKYEVGERRLDILETKKICHLCGWSLEQFVAELEKRLGSHNETN